jgi:hypothetical protein
MLRDHSDPPDVVPSHEPSDDGPSDDGPSDDGPAGPPSPPVGSPIGPPVPARTPAKPVRASWRWVLVGEIVALVVLIAGLFIDGVVRDFCSSGLQLLPVVVIAQLALVAEGRLWARLVGGFGLGLLLFLLVLMVVTISAWTTLLMRGQDLQAFNDPTQLPLAEIGAAGRWMLLVLAVTALLLYTPLRKGLARLVPFEPTRPVHRTALWLTLLISAGSLVPMFVTSRPLLLALAEQGKLAQLMPEAGRLLLQQAMALGWLIPAAFLAAGAWVTRSPSQTLERLGLRGWTWIQLLLAAFAGLALVGMFELLVDPGLQWLWRRQGWLVTDAAAMEQLFGALMGWAGVFIVSISAGVGEELGLRGLLQPRVGVLLTNVLFMSLHAMQYHADGLVSVFLGGLVMGLARKHTNTAVSITIHTFFDIGAFASFRLRR